MEYTYTYDTSGNIRTVETTNTKTKKTTTDTYEYTDSDWKDLLASYNGTAITYDAVGNPLSYIAHRIYKLWKNKVKKSKKIRLQSDSGWEMLCYVWRL